MESITGRQFPQLLTKARVPSAPTVDSWAETNSSSCGVKGAKIGLGLDQSDLSPDESTTNIGPFKAGTGSSLEHVDQLLLTWSAQPGTGAWSEFG